MPSGASLVAAQPSRAVPQVFGNEDLVVVTEGGCDPLPSFRRDIRSLPWEGDLGSPRA